MQKKISYLEQERGQRSPSVATMAYIFLFSRVKYCPFHSQYVICSFPYDRSMIRFKNVLWFTVARGGARFLSFSRLFRAPTNSSVGVARHKINALSNAIISKNYKSPWNKATPYYIASYGNRVETSKTSKRGWIFRERERKSSDFVYDRQFSEMTRYFPADSINVRILRNRFYSSIVLSIYDLLREFFWILIFKLAKLWNNRTFTFVGTEFDSHRFSRSWFDKVFESISLHEKKNRWPFRKR